MIVGIQDIQPSEVRKQCRDVESLRAYCTQLVPRVIRHDSRIVSNQKYIVALIVRDLKSIPYERRKELCEGLLEDVSIFGIANQIYDFEDIMSEVDINLLSKYILQEEG